MASDFRKVKLELVGAQAKPGPLLASLGINMAQFTKDFNDRTKDMNGDVVPVLITIKPNKSFTFVLKSSPTPYLLKKAAKIEKAAADSKKMTVGTVTMKQVEEIAKIKLQDSNAYEIEAMKKMVVGTAKQMGIKVE